MKGALDAHVWQEGKDPETLLVDYKGSKVAVVAGTRWEEYKIFRQPNLLLRVDLGGPKMAVSNGLFEKGYRYVVEEVPPPKRSPPPTLAEIAAVLKDFLGAVAYGVHLSMSKKEKAPADPAEKAKDE